MTSYTVTANNSDGSPGIYLQAEVITNATESGGASAAIGDGTSGSTSLTPNFPGSFIAWAGEAAVSGVTSLVPVSNNKLLTVAANTDSFEDTVDGYTAGAGYYSGTVTGGVGLTVGFTGSTINEELAAYEVPKSGGSWAEDASTPAWVNTQSTHSITTASFSPPGGAVLVATVTVNYSGSGNPTTTITVSSTPSLTWTARKFSANALSNGGCAVYTATIPGGGPVLSGPPLTSRMLPNFPSARIFRRGSGGAHSW